MDRVIGFIGSGNMGQAMIGGILKANLVKPHSIMVCDPDQTKLEMMQKTYGVTTTAKSSELAAQSDVIVLAVKPDIYPVVLKEISGHVRPESLIVTIAAGRSLSEVEGFLGAEVKAVRTMPNTPALVNAGMTALCPNGNVTEQELAEIRQIFESFGKAEVIPEKLMDAVVGISGSSPAYVFMFIEALADAGVRGGLPRDKAYLFAAQAVKGAAQMVLETGKHPGELKDMVCSPGGTTIEAVSILEAEGMRSSVIKAVEGCIRKSGEMGKK